MSTVQTPPHVFYNYRNYGAVVEFILPDTDKRPPSALLHLSQMDHKMVSWKGCFCVVYSTVVTTLLAVCDFVCLLRIGAPSQYVGTEERRHH